MSICFQYCIGSASDLQRIEEGVILFSVLMDTMNNPDIC